MRRNKRKLIKAPFQKYFEVKDIYRLIFQ